MATNKGTDPKTRYYLNALNKSNRTLPPPTTRGAWFSHPKFLTDYAQSVSVQGQLADDRAVHSVPSVFQRPILFYRALKDPKHPLHSSFQKQWRGLMAALCLSEWLHLDVEVKSFPVPPQDPKARSSVGTTPPGDLHFRAILRNQLPLRAETDDQGNTELKTDDWDQWYLIRSGGSVLGATSPWTFLYTSSHRKAPPSIPWQSEGLLIDPIEHYKKTPHPRELSILYAWVNSIVEAAEPMGSEEQEREASPPEPGSVAEQPENLGPATATEPSVAPANSYDGQTAETEAPAHHEPPSRLKYPTHLTEARNLVFGAETGLFKVWRDELEPYKDPTLRFARFKSIFPAAPYSFMRIPTDLDGGQSDLLVQRERGQRQLLLLSKQLDQEKRVLGGVFSSRVDVSSLPAEGERFVTKDGTTIPHAYVVPEKLFFPPRLVRIPSMKSAAKTSTADVSIPLTPAFFRYFKHSDLDRVTLSRSTGGYDAKLELPLRGGGNLIVIHHYSDQDVKTLPLTNLAFAVWPDHDDPDWTEAFAAYAAPSQGVELAVAPLLAGGGVAQSAAKDDSHQEKVRIWRSTSLPIGFSLSVRHDKSYSPAGLLLRKVLPVPRPLDDPHEWQIGVDFGTSSTMVMVRKGDGDPEEMEFGGHLVILAGEQDVADEITQNLYPANQVRTPFRTLLYQSAATIFDSAEPRYTVRFASSAQDLDRAVKDVKWGGRSEDGGASPLMIYLKGLVRYIVWELRVRGVRSAKFHWSYPLSLPAGSLSVMREFWMNSVSKNYSHTNGMTITVEADGISESEAACKAFIKAGATPGSRGLTITVDIGGGSTDIGFFTQDKLCDQVSFKVAGNDILDPDYVTEAALREFFLICYGIPMPDTELAGVKARPEIYLNGALAEARKNGTIFRDKNLSLHPIPAHIGAGHRHQFPWFNFRSMIYLYFTGLVYYLGTHSRMIDVETATAEILFGGRASALLTWLTPRDFLPVMEVAFKNGMALPGAPKNIGRSLRVRFSGLALNYDPEFPHLKAEVAEGLLVKSQMTVKLPGAKDGPYAGEVEWKTSDGRKLQWQSCLKPADYGMLVPPTDFESTAIGNYRFQMLAADPNKDAEKYFKTLGLDDRLSKLYVESNALDQMMSKARVEKDPIPQPLFAYELKALMHQYAQEVRKHPTGDPETK